MAVIDLNDYDTPEKVAELSEIDPEFAQALKDRPQKLLDFSDIPILRENLGKAEEAMVGLLPPLPPSIKQTNVSIPLRDGASTSAILVYPAADNAPKDGCPLVVMWHGGGFMLCSPLQVVPRARGLAQLLSCAVLCPSYRLAPENPFPTGVLDAWDSVLFASKAENFKPHDLAINHSKGFIIGGLSAGANFGGVLAQKAKDEKLTPPLTGQYIGWPGFFVRDNSVPDKYKHLFFATEQNAHEPTQTFEDILTITNTAKLQIESPLFNPLNVKGDYPRKHEGLPKAFVQTGGMDALRDDALVFARVMKDAGVETLTMCYKGLPHASSLVYPDLQSSKEAGGDTARGFAWMLGVEKGDWDESKANELAFPSPE